MDNSRASFHAQPLLVSLQSEGFTSWDKKRIARVAHSGFGIPDAAASCDKVFLFASGSQPGGKAFGHNHSQAGSTTKRPHHSVTKLSLIPILSLQKNGVVSSPSHSMCRH